MQNYNVTWYINATKWYGANTTKYAGVDLTECFKDTFLRWLPLTWLFISLLIGTPFLFRAQRPPHLADTPICALQLIRVLLALLFLSVSLADMVYSAVVSSFSWFANASVATILTPSLESAMLVCKFFYIEYSIF